MFRIFKMCPKCAKCLKCVQNVFRMLPDLFLEMTPSPPENLFLAGSVDSPEEVEVAGAFSYW
jgi:hypothetical protein